MRSGKSDFPGRWDRNRFLSRAIPQFSIVLPGDAGSDVQAVVICGPVLDLKNVLAARIFTVSQYLECLPATVAFCPTLLYLCPDPFRQWRTEGSLRPPAFPTKHPGCIGNRIGQIQLMRSCTHAVTSRRLNTSNQSPINGGIATSQEIPRWLKRRAAAYAAA